MKVILLENVKKIGSIGEVIDVRRGFARNFLIANKKALYASKENIKQVEKDLGTMKSNLNALYGAIQQVDRLIAKVKDGDKKLPAEKEKALNLATS